MSSAAATSSPTSSLFSPMRIGEFGADHRIVMAPLTRLRNSPQGVPQQPLVADYYRQRCHTPGTLIIAEASVVSLRGGAAAYMPGMHSADQLQSWKQVVDAVHEAGCRIVCQLVAAGRAADPQWLHSHGFDLAGADAIPMDASSPTPRRLRSDEIPLLVEDFASAAGNAIDVAGFDAVEIHAANGYLIDQFLQDVSNQRDDGYGGSVANRNRFALEVTAAVAQRIGKDRTGIRVSPYNAWQGMRSKDPLSQFTPLVQELSKLDVAFLHIIQSRVDNNVDVEREETLEPLLEAWGKTKPVLIAGGWKPQDIVEDCKRFADYNFAAVFGRYFISNPDLVHRIRHRLSYTPYDRDTFYTPGERRGYIDYPFAQQASEIEVK